MQRSENSPSELDARLAQLWQDGLELWLEAGQLRFAAPKALLSNDTMAFLKANKAAIIAQLEQQPLCFRGYPLSEGQKSIYWMQQLSPNCGAYNQLAVLELQADADLDVLQHSWQTLCQRHAVLRARFVAQDGLVKQYTVEDLPPFQIKSVEDWSQSRIDQWIDEVADAPFDLANGPLIRADLLDKSTAATSGPRYILTVTAHHLVADFWALELLLKELCQLYLNERLARGGATPDPLPELHSQYKDFVLSEAKMLAGEGGEKLAHYWQQAIPEEPPVINLPTDKPRPAQPGFQGSEHQFLIDAETTRGLRALAKQWQLTPFVLVLSLWQTLLQRYSGENKISIGTPLAARTRKEWQQIAGHFTNALPIVADLSDKPSLQALARQNQKSIQGALQHQDYPFQKLVDRLVTRRDSSRPPLFQCGMVWNQLGSTENTLIAAVQRMEQRGAIYDLVLSCYDAGDTIHASWRYNSELFAPARITKITEQFQTLLSDAIAHSDKRINHLSLISAAALYQELGVDAASTERVLPLTAVQTDLYLAHVVNPDTRSNSLGEYAELNVAALSEQSGKPFVIDVERLQTALNNVAAKHAILRSRIVASTQPFTDIAYWVVAKQPDLKLVQVDISEQVAKDPDAVAAYVDKKIHQGYDVYGQLADFELVKTADNSYLLLCAANHLVFDGLAVTEVIVQWLTHYMALADSGIDATVPADNFADYIDYSRQHFDSAEVMDFWRTQLGSTEALDMPAPLQQGNGDFRHNFAEISADKLAQLREYCNARKMSVARLFKVLYGVLIHSYGNTDSNFQIRDTWGGRPEGHERTLGCYYNMVPFVFPDRFFNHAADQESATLTDLLQYTREHTRESRPYSLISLTAQRQLADQGAVGFMFNYYTVAESVTVGEVEFPLHLVQPLEVEGQVQLIMRERNQQLYLELLYYDDIFPDFDFLGRLIYLADQVVNGVERLDELEIAFADERAALLSTEPGAWNGTAEILGDAVAVHQIIEQQVAATPDAAALSYAGSSWSYRQLNEKANQLAHYLRDLGVGPDVLVGVCLERSLEMSLSVLAVLKAGGAYVPFDPSFPHDRLAYMAEDTAIKVMLTQTHLQQAVDLDSIVPETATTLVVDAVDKPWSHYCADNPPLTVSSDNLINVIFTSGSTGKPKGVMVPHGGIVNRLLWMQREYPIGPGDRVLQKTPYSFDVSVWELFWPFMVGAELVYARPEGHKDPGYLRDLIQEENISTLHFVPSMLGLFLQTDGVEQCRSIKRVFCSGEALQLEHERRFFDRLGFAELHNLYGPTEASVDVSYFACQPNSTYRSVPIGKPVANTQLHVLDKQLRVLPVGLVGELHIGGVQLARGYLNREALTANTFIHNPYFETGHPSERLYKTGDLARYQADGNIEYIGRVDFQVKVRGLRIELGEIETRLHQHPAVAETIVITREMSPGNVLIIAYIVKSADGISDEDLRSYLGETLPEYMIPNAFVSLDAIPLSPNGKANRKALPDPDLSGGGHEYVAPRNEPEQQIADIWRTVLNVERVGIHDNFFELGGHSLLATQVAGRIQDQLQYTLSMRDLFEHPTVAELAGCLNSAAEQQQIEVPLVARDEPLQLSLAQQRLWFVEQLTPGLTAYNMPGAYRFRGALDPTALQTAFNAVIARQEVLRSSFHAVNGQPLVQIADTLEWQLPQTDLSHLTEEEFGREAVRIARDIAQQSFDLTRAPLFSAHYLRHGDDDHVLIFNIHHIIFDGWSVEVLLAELGQLVTGAELAPLEFQYLDFAAWQREQQNDAQLAEAMNYWLEQLDGVAPLLALPTDKPRPSVQTYSGGQFNFQLDKKLVEELRSLCLTHNVSLFMLLLGAYSLLLSRYIQDSDVVVAAPIAGRNFPALEKLIGFFVNNLVLRIDVSGNPLLADFLQRVRSTTLEAFDHQDIAFDTIVDALNFERDLSYTPLMQAAFALQPQSVEAYAEAAFGMPVEPLDLEWISTKYDWNLICFEADSGIDVLFEYNADLYERDTIEAFAAQFEFLLQQIGVNSSARIDSFAGMPPAQLYRQLGIEQTGGVELRPLNARQLQLLARYQADAEAFAQNNAVLISADSVLDRDRLQGAFNRLLEHAPLLGATLLQSSARLAKPAYWAIAPQGRNSVAVQELNQDSAAIDKQVKDRINTLLPLDDALLSLQLIETDGQSKLLLVAHPLFLDTPALAGLARALFSIYFDEAGVELAINAVTDQHLDAPEYLEYWQRQLASVETLDISSVPGAGGWQRQHETIGGKDYAALQAYCTENHCGLRDLLRACFAMLMQTYSRNSENILATEIARNNTSSRSAVALTAYPLVIETGLFKPGQSLDTLIKSMHERDQQAQDFLPVSARYLAAYQPEEQVMFSFAYQHCDDVVARAGFSADIFVGDNPDGDVQIGILDTGRELQLSMHYLSDAFGDKSFLTRFPDIIEQMLAAEHLRDIRFVTDAEHDLLLATQGSGWNATRFDYPPVATIHALFEAQVMQTPDAIALQYEESSWSYAEFNRRANHLAHYLRELGVGRDTLVGVCMERSLEMSLALMAILKAGGAYVPFDPDFPQDRLGFMMEDTEATILLTQTHLLGRVPGQGITRLCLDSDTDQAKWSQCSGENPHAVNEETDLFNVIFTSGSTGKPKGVMVPHQGVINRLRWMQTAYPLTQDDVVLQKTPYSFDVSVWEFFWPVMSGAKLVFAKPDGHKQPAYLRDLIRRSSVTTLHFVPSMLGIFLQEKDIESCQSIQRVFCSGEALQLEHERRFFERLPGKELHNLYGPTEASVDVSYFACNPEEHYRSVPIGKPVHNTQLHILDEHMQLVPVGVAGELYIGGVQLARGYLKREELTAKTFVENPFHASGHPSARLYKTGDLARYKPDGNIEYIGRVDFQVKVRGLRIELGEIETVLHRHPDIREIVVITKELGPDNVIIVAYTVLEQAVEASPTLLDEVREYLGEHLPEYMIPNAFVLLDEIPLSPNGKVNRKALPEPDLSVDETVEYEAPRNETEETLLSIWQEVLGVEGIGIHHNFFTLGGHSLLATQITSRIYDALNIDVPVKSVFEHPTIAGLAEAILALELQDMVGDDDDLDDLLSQLLDEDDL